MWLACSARIFPVDLSWFCPPTAGLGCCACVSRDGGTIALRSS